MAERFSRFLRKQTGWDLSTQNGRGLTDSTEVDKMDEIGLLQWEGLNGFQVLEDNPRKLNVGVGEMGDA